MEKSFSKSHLFNGISPLQKKRHSSLQGSAWPKHEPAQGFQAILQVRQRGCIQRCATAWTQTPDMIVKHRNIILERRNEDVTKFARHCDKCSDVPMKRPRQGKRGCCPSHKLASLQGHDTKHGPVAVFARTIHDLHRGANAAASN